MSDTKIRINEIFHSIQGESLFAGKPSVFIRTSECNLRCKWCDTKYAYWEGNLMSVSEILQAIKKYEAEYVCVTGGEPLGQRGTIELLEELLKNQYIVSLETNGSFSVKDVPEKVVKIIDIKCPDSGVTAAMAWENLGLAQKHDQFKFVVASRQDFEWADQICQEHKLHEKCTVLYSPAYGLVKPSDLAAWILDSKSKVTMQMQLHKEIWGPDERGV